MHSCFRDISMSSVMMSHCVQALSEIYIYNLTEINTTMECSIHNQNAF